MYNTHSHQHTTNNNHKCYYSYHKFIKLLLLLLLCCIISYLSYLFIFYNHYQYNSNTILLQQQYKQSSYNNHHNINYRNHNNLDSKQYISTLLTINDPNNHHQQFFPSSSSSSIQLQSSLSSSSSFSPTVSIISACKDRSEQLITVIQSWLLIYNITEIILIDWNSQHSLQSMLHKYNLTKHLYQYNTNLNHTTINHTHSQHQHDHTNDNPSSSSPFSAIPIKIIELHTDSTFHLSLAYNLAATFTTTTYILKLDCDIWIHDREFIKNHPFHKQETQSSSLSSTLFSPISALFTSSSSTTPSPYPLMYYRGNWKLASNTNQKHINGILFILRYHFFAVGGYDE